MQDRQQGGAQARGLSACTTCPSRDPPPTSAPCKTPLRSVRLSICQSPVVPISPLPRCSAPTGSCALLWTPVRLSLAGPSPARWPWAPRVSPFGAALGGGAAAARTSELSRDSRQQPRNATFSGAASTFPARPAPGEGREGAATSQAHQRGAGGASADALSPRPAWTVPDSKHLCVQAPWVRRLRCDPRGHSGAIRQ